MPLLWETTRGWQSARAGKQTDHRDKTVPGPIMLQVCGDKQILRWKATLPVPIGNVFLSISRLCFSLANTGRVNIPPNGYLTNWGIKRSTFIVATSSDEIFAFKDNNHPLWRKREILDCAFKGQYEVSSSVETVNKRHWKTLQKMSGGGGVQLVVWCAKCLGIMRGCSGVCTPEFLHCTNTKPH